MAHLVLERDTLKPAFLHLRKFCLFIRYRIQYDLKYQHELKNITDPVAYFVDNIMIQGANAVS
jgi:hypothetical protein